MSMKEAKTKRMRHIEKLERLILEIHNWAPDRKMSKEITSKLGVICSYEERDNRLEFLKESLEAFKTESDRDYGKKFLSEIIEEEGVEFKSNSLILAPVGSGKTTLILEDLAKDVKGKILYLASNTALKDSVCPDDNKERKNAGHRLYTTRNKSKFGEADYEIHVMTYAEFGARIEYRDDFAKEFEQIHCDEIHSLPIFKDIGTSPELILAIKYLFQEQAGQKIFYYTATDEGLDRIKRNGVLKDVDTFDYLNHPNIRKYMTLSEYRINNMDQIRIHLRARLESFKYFGYKCLAYTKTIESQLKISEIAKEEGFNPIVLWSTNRSGENKVMDKEQIRVRDILLNTGHLPEPYNFLIINGAMQEGWNLIDPKVKLAIMNTTNKTEKTQALGRLRGDLDVLVYRVGRDEEVDVFINLPTYYYERDLTKQMKDELCKDLDIRKDKNTYYKWTTVSGILENQGYHIKERTITQDGKRTRVSYITT